MSLLHAGGEERDRIDDDVAGDEGDVGGARREAALPRG